jgi:hypothetical protein
MIRVRTRLRQAALVLFGAAALWTLIVLVSGGLVFRLGPVRISARRALNPAVIALAAAAATWGLATATERRRAIDAAGAHLLGQRGILHLASRQPHCLARAAAAGAALAILLFGLLRGTFVAGGADAYGYVSQADLWAEGSLIVRQPAAQAMTWPHAAEALAPLGYRPYRPAAHGTDIVPVYSPGVPMLMAAAKRLAGAHAVYLVVPFLGAVAVWATFAMGMRLAGPLAGASAAVLLAASPPMLFEVISPASDVAATAWWSLAFMLLLRDSPFAAFGAGVAAGAGILTRPNLVVLAVVPAALLAWRAAQSTDYLGHGRTRGLSFAAGMLPACIAVALLNQNLYGSPLASGYGSLDDLYEWANVFPNLARYPIWLLESETPVVILALAAPLVLRASRGFTPEARATACAWLGAIIIIFFLYLLYRPFDEWWYLRFILPVYPLLLALTGAVLVALATPLARVARPLPAVAVVAVVAAVAWHGVAYATDQGVATAWQTEQRYVKAGAYIARTLPDRAALVSMQHSGSARYYSGRLTVRYDHIEPAHLELVLGELRRLGYVPYFVLDEGEEPIFRSRFLAHSDLAALDWTPVALIHRNIVRIYDPADRGPGGASRVPDVVD